MYIKHDSFSIDKDLFPKRKPRVFVSGRCDGEYASIREQIVEWFEHIPLLEFYDFNSEGSSTLPLSEAYLSKIDTCDVFLLILDNQIGITDGTRREIDRAIELNKPFMGIFINNVKNSIGAQTFLPYFSKCKYVTIDSFDDASKEAISSLLQDLVDRYCLHLREGFDDNSKTFRAADIGVKKEIHDLARPLTNYLICRDYPYLNEDNPDASPFSKALLNVFRCVIGLSPFSEKELSLVSKHFISNADEAIKEMLKKRFEVLNLVFKGLLRDGKGKLESILSHNIQPLPVWLKDDVCLDLRNLSIRLDRNDGLWRRNVDGQKELDESKVEIHYPYLDRCYVKLWEGLDDRFYERRTKSPNTITLGDNLHFYCFLAEAFVTALSFGSYTHLMAFRNKYFRFQYRLCYEGKEARRFGELNRLAILMSNEKDLQKIWNVAPHDNEIIRESNIAEVVATLKTIPIREERIQATLLSIAYLGDYLSDEDFDFFFGVCDREGIAKIYENELSNINISLILTVYRKNIGRIGARIKGLLDATKSFGFASYDLSSVRRLCMVGLENQKLFPLFLAYVEDRVDIDGYLSHESFFINARLRYTEFCSSIDEFVYSHANATEADEYKRFCLISNPNDAIFYYAERIKEYSSRLQSNESISFPLEMPCEEAENFICVHKNRLSQHECFDELAKSAIDLLNSRIGQAEAKFAAVKLLCTLEGFGFGTKNIGPFKAGVRSNADSICNGVINSPMETITSANLWFALYVLHGMNDKSDDYVIREALTASFDYPRDKIATLSALKSALSSSNEPPYCEGTMIAIMNFAWQCFLNDNTATSNSGFNVLRLFNSYAEYKETIARGFRDLFSMATAEQKVAIASFFKNNGSSKYFDSIKGAGVASVCWSVRNIFD